MGHRQEKGHSNHSFQIAYVLAKQTAVLSRAKYPFSCSCVGSNVWFQSYSKISIYNRQLGKFCNSYYFYFFFFFNKCIYLFCLCWVFVSVRGLSPVAASRGHSSSRCADLLLSRPLPLQSTGSRRASSVVVAHGPSCSVSCGIFPNQGSNPCTLHWQADS